jgi:hypothetical protein
MFGWVAASAQPGPLKVFVATGRQVIVETRSPGFWECEGGERTTTGPPFCSPGSTHISFWNLSSLYKSEELKGSAADLIDGELTTFVNGDFDGKYFGHMFGTFEWKVPGMGGQWLGTFTAVADQMRGLVVNKAVGYGSGGKLEGLKLEFYQVTPGAGQPSAFVAQVSTK